VLEAERASNWGTRSAHLECCLVHLERHRTEVRRIPIDGRRIILHSHVVGILLSSHRR